MATKVRATIKGGDRFKERMKRAVPESELELRKVLFDEAKGAAKEAIDAVSAPKSERLYKAKRKGTDSYYSWRASAPGEPPARRTGRSVGQIKAKRQKRKFKPGAQIRLPKIFRLLAKRMPRSVSEKGRVMGAVLPRPLMGPIMAKRRERIWRAIEAVAERVLGVGVRRKKDLPGEENRGSGRMPEVIEWRAPLEAAAGSVIHQADAKPALHGSADFPIDNFSGFKSSQVESRSRSGVSEVASLQELPVLRHDPQGRNLIDHALRGSTFDELFDR